VNEELQLRRGVDFGGSPWSVKICDIDGDGTKEALCQTWNNITVFIIKATGTNTYEMSTPYTMCPDDDINIIGMGVGDVDGDNADEVYVGGYFTGYLYVIDGVTDAMAMDTTNFYLMSSHHIRCSISVSQIWMVMVSPAFISPPMVVFMNGSSQVRILPIPIIMHNMGSSTGICWYVR